MLKFLGLLAVFSALQAAETLYFQDVVNSVPGMAEMHSGDGCYQFNGSLFQHNGQTYQIRSCLFLTPPGSDVDGLNDLKQFTPPGQNPWVETASLQPVNIGFGTFQIAQKTFFRYNLYVEFPAPIPLSSTEQMEILYHLSLSIGQPFKGVKLEEELLPSSSSLGLLTIADVFSNIPEVAGQAQSWMVLPNPAQYTFQKKGYLFQLVHSAFDVRSEASPLDDGEQKKTTLQEYCITQNMMDHQLDFQSFVKSDFEYIQWMDDHVYIKLMLRRIKSHNEMEKFTDG